MTNDEARKLQPGDLLRTRWGTATVRRIVTAHDGTNPRMKGIPPVVIYTMDAGSFLPESVERLS